MGYVQFLSNNFSTIKTVFSSGMLGNKLLTSNDTNFELYGSLVVLIELINCSKFLMLCLASKLVCVL